MLLIGSLRWTRWLAAGAAICLAAACDPPAPTSENPITGASVADDGSDLVGAWHGELDGSEAYVHVVQGGHGGILQTLVIGHQDGHANQEGGSWGQLLAIPSNIDGSGYLSVEVVQDEGRSVDDPIEQGYHLVRYRTGPGSDYVTIYALDEDRIAQAIKNGELAGDLHTDRLQATSQELIRFIEKHGGQDLFSVQIGYLERVSDEELPKIESAR